MKLFLYAIYDVASGIYDGPWKARTDEEAKRMFGNIAVDPKHPIGQHPEDYSLVRVGDWNDGNAEITRRAREVIVTGLECVASKGVIEPGGLLDDVAGGVNKAVSEGLDADGYPLSSGGNGNAS